MSAKAFFGIQDSVNYPGQPRVDLFVCNNGREPLATLECSKNGIYSVNVDAQEWLSTDGAYVLADGLRVLGSLAFTFNHATLVQSRSEYAREYLGAGGFEPAKSFPAAKA